ncbi:hypothetical protein Hypma_013512 [Hypsizygus marmoreus]|uniref:Uncharacterized protein n=1 Tax=Hypsizygus marmoreus TaxID=39966 RepID=A0A369JKE7_HYPMA|nr:hypothetical protein Hypma_013512 [Hypsizygus marmoreus]
MSAVEEVSMNGVGNHMGPFTVQSLDLEDHVGLNWKGPSHRPRTERVLEAIVHPENISLNLSPEQILRSH